MHKISWSKYIAAFSLTVLIFVSGIFLGEVIGSGNIDELAQAQEEARLNILGLNVQTNIIREKLCTSNIFSIDRTALGKQVESLENIFGKDDPRVLSIKKEYTLLSINQWLLVEEYNSQCEKKINTILFFYANKENITREENQGYILDYIFENNKESVVIYAIDASIVNPATATLLDIYNISSYPTLVINGQRYEDIRTRDEIESLLIK